MKHFTPDDALLNFGGNLKPREQTLMLIRQAAYTYRKNIKQACSLN